MDSGRACCEARARVSKKAAQPGGLKNRINSLSIHLVAPFMVLLFTRLQVVNPEQCAELTSYLITNSLIRMDLPVSVNPFRYLRTRLCSCNLVGQHYLGDPLTLAQHHACPYKFFHTAP